MTRPDDWHLHLREGAMLARVLPHTARCFGRAMVMPNLDPPMATAEQAEGYAERIRSLLPEDSTFEPLMTLYLTDAMSREEVERASKSAQVAAIKFYPKGATTHSAHGVDALEKLSPVLEALEDHDLPLLVHGESVSVETDIFDRERRFLEDTLAPLVSRHEGLRIVFEHITTAEAAAFVEESPARVGATITPQHLLMNRNAIFEGGLRPHHYCLPVLKRERDRVALVRAATGGDPSFFLGTDSAPHERAAKEAPCGCAGIFSAPIAIECYAEAFARAGALGRLEGFASHHGADFYRLPRNRDSIYLDRLDWTGPDFEGAVKVFWAGEPLRYRMREATRGRTDTLDAGS
ncbi:MAG: dihydroorotase [Deltaproteobacteria bacterium]|nr:dihydroorotase [Deltaproteobacteria bacterium]